ncbi:MULTISPECIES: ATP-binding protein [unclassified Fusibacter]|uniref:ATP-binding protein n=1 Tax=unclassified Fusibacter TaxID=2624464 RepID=UPI00101310D2|nr:MULTISPECIES: ATP-binding protein [unclassified Fusibacter]MCK8058154.1 ATP-binding protein [Fusibacter sp. A2]NPE20736.1 sensor histidine kinase [Fusibacter sp. A1]RXV62942.1 ATP-binding protein [Fusibacter sp. A1]
MLNRLGQNYYTSNKMLNIILNDKVQTMRAQGISEDIKIADVDLSFIRNVDMTTLFSNILDNAIEAALVSDEKKIHLRVSHVHDFVTITLKNTSAEKPLKKDDDFLTTKPHHEGLGLKNVKRVVEAYKGDVQFEWRDAHFITRVMLTG